MKISKINTILVLERNFPKAKFRNYVCHERKNISIAIPIDVGLLSSQKRYCIYLNRALHTAQYFIETWIRKLLNDRQTCNWKPIQKIHYPFSYSFIFAQTDHFLKTNDSPNSNSNFLTHTPMILRDITESKYSFPGTTMKINLIFIVHIHSFSDKGQNQLQPPVSLNEKKWRLKNCHRPTYGHFPTRTE